MALSMWPVAVPRAIGFLHLGHCKNGLVVLIFAADLPQPFEKSAIFRTPVRIEEHDPAGKPLRAAFTVMLRKGVMPMPPARKTEGLDALL